jgi:diguanylate cyclase (GGDEF)-like protein/PAS domain S-box-containing protein
MPPVHDCKKPDPTKLFCLPLGLCITFFLSGTASANFKSSIVSQATPIALLLLATWLSFMLWRIIRKRASQESALLDEIKERESRLNLALWGSGDEFWDWNIPENTLYRLGANQLLGQGASEDSGSDGWRSHSVHPDDQARVQTLLEEHLLGTTEVYESEHRIRNHKGEWIWVRSRGKLVARDSDGKPLRMAGTARDITAIRNAERERLVALEVLRSMSEAVAVIDLAFCFISVNPAFSRITNYTEDEVIGKNSDILDSSQHGGDFYRRVREILDRTGHWAGEMWQKRKDGDEFLGWIEMSEVSDLQGVRAYFVAVVNDITDKKRAEQELRYLANYDTLTGLPNRALLSERLGRAIVRARRQETRVAVLFLDLDRFKDINDSLGHAAGDRLLKAAASRIQTTISASDTVARLGGDEFTVILEDVESLAAVERMAREILTAFSMPLEVDDRHDVNITPSLGISLYPDHALVPTDLLKFADTAMYQAKAEGRNTFQIYNETMDAESRRRAQILASLRKAIDKGEFRLVYQPRMSLSDGRITGVEALIRWHSTELGDISPMTFIPLAEESGLIIPIGEWVLQEACQTLKRWRNHNLMDLSMAVNVSAIQLLRGNLKQSVKRTLEETGIPANRLELEITESMVMENAEQSTKLLNEIRDLGVSLAIDDFGTGYSSLVYLKRLPINTLKIDKAFVGDLVDDPDDEAITATIISMSHSLGLNVIAEGVENEQQLRYLREQGCDEIQGYWLSPPIDGHRCLAFIRSWQPNSIVSIPAAY